MKDDFLPLETNVFGPLDESGEVLLGREITTCPRQLELLSGLHQPNPDYDMQIILTDTKTLWRLVKQRVLRRLGSLLGAVYLISLRS